MSKPFSGTRMNMNQMNGNNRRPSNITRLIPVDKATCPQHDELIKFIFESWNKVSQEVDSNTGNTVIYYHEEHQNLKDFEPFDLHGYSNRKTIQNSLHHS